MQRAVQAPWEVACSHLTVGAAQERKPDANAVAERHAAMRVWGAAVARVVAAGEAAACPRETAQGLVSTQTGSCPWPCPCPCMRVRCGAAPAWR